jgi:hypothetical protein
MEDAAHLDVLLEAIRLEGGAHRLLLEGDPGAVAGFREASERYRRSWELAPPRSFGRLIGMLKALVLAGGAEAAQDAARYVLDELGGELDSPASSYAAAIARLVLGDDEAAARAAEGMAQASPAFVRTAEAITAIAQRDRARYDVALAAIVADFESRDEHLTGVRIADTALMLERLAEPRGVAARPSSAVLGTAED